MKEIKTTPFALLRRKDEIRPYLNSDVWEKIKDKGKDNDLFGLVLEIKAIEKIDTPELFMEYMFGKSNKK